MTLTPTLTSPSDLLCKLAREQHRAFHVPHPTHKADHLYNFCVTALAVKDYIFEYLSITEDSQKQPYHETWSKIPELLAATEIANSSKHFVCRDIRTKDIKIPKTKSVKHSTSTVIDVYEDTGGKLHRVKRENAADFEIELDDGNILRVWEFTNTVLSYWKSFLQNKSIPYTLQTEKEFFGIVT